MLAGTVRTKAIPVIMILAAVGALTTGIVISTGPIQALLFTAMTASAAIITSMFVVVVNWTAHRRLNS